MHNIYPMKLSEGLGMYGWLEFATFKVSTRLATGKSIMNVPVHHIPPTQPLEKITSGFFGVTSLRQKSSRPPHHALDVPYPVIGGKSIGYHHSPSPHQLLFALKHTVTPKRIS